LFDPELTRGLQDPPDAAARARVLDFVSQELVVEVDGLRLALEPEVRELWVRGGAVPGDSVVFVAPLPERASKLVVRAPQRMKQLLVAVALPTPSSHGELRSTLIAGGEATAPFELVDPDPPAPPSAFAYLKLGFAHVLPLGLDHLLFLVALVLGSERSWRRLLALSLGFTAAHTLTLGLGATGTVTVPAGIVEPLIALSIVALALSNLWQRERRHEPVWVLAFGLLHGLGFAGALSAIGLPPSGVVVPLLCFNVGVELAQIVVVGLVWLLLRPLDEQRVYPYAVRPGSLCIALVGLFWTVQRVL
jgi:hypothetical protein